MDSLRISLIVIGIIILLALFFGSKLIPKKRDSQQPGRKIPSLDEQTPPDQSDQSDEWEVIPLKSSDQSSSTPAPAEVADATPVVTDDLKAESVLENSVEVTTAESAPASEPSESNEKPATTPVMPTVIALHIVAKEGEFVGAELVKAANLAAMRYGEMGIFHFLGATSGAVTFSMANMLEPGTFDLENLNGFTTPGVLLFMESEQQDELATSLGSMVKVAQSICEQLDGQLCDDHRRPMDIKHLTTWKADHLGSQLKMPL
ncbi:Cell division protein ZipA [hydrothermal vent metagenome]|uniref:Cell division protein ZipA n=1 Tax=hydrothermal vent metagenome TaxID=652676 RepID=A0A3B0Z7F0_9ZZZZ